MCVCVLTWRSEDNFWCQSSTLSTSLFETVAWNFPSHLCWPASPQICLRVPGIGCISVHHDSQLFYVGLGIELSLARCELTDLAISPGFCPNFFHLPQLRYLQTSKRALLHCKVTPSRSGPSNPRDLTLKVAADYCLSVCSPCPWLSCFLPDVPTVSEITYISHGPGI